LRIDWNNRHVLVRVTRRINVDPDLELSAQTLRGGTGPFTSPPSDSLELRFRLQTQSGPPDQDGCEHYRGGEVGCELVIANCDASPILEAAEHAFDEIAAAVGDLIEGMKVFYALGCSE
jgi:hypothetical protein